MTCGNRWANVNGDGEHACKLPTDHVGPCVCPCPTAAVAGALPGACRYRWGEEGHLCGLPPGHEGDHVCGLSRVCNSFRTRPARTPITRAEVERRLRRRPENRNGGGDE